jgi:tRNA (guanine-N7-)-methyltransferase
MQMAVSHGKKTISSRNCKRKLAKQKLSTENISAPASKRRFYGRKQTRALNQSRQSAMDDLFPALSINADLLEKPAALSPKSLFPDPYQKFWLEIGFGSGEHLKALIERHQDIGFLGAEPFINGTAAFLKSIHESQPGNVRILMDDALKLVSALEDSSLERIYILNPDPWPKKRHHKRRIVNEETLPEFSRVLMRGGLFIMATDVDDLAEWMVTKTMQNPDFEWKAETSDDWKTPPADWAIQTRYAEKGVQAGRRQSYLVFQKIK